MERPDVYGLGGMMLHKLTGMLVLLVGVFLLTDSSADATHGTLPTPGCELSPCVITVGNHFGEYGGLHNDSEYQKAVEMAINDWSKSGVFLKFVPSTVPNKDLPTGAGNPCQGGMISVCVSAGTTGLVTNLYADGKFTISASCEVSGCSAASVAIKYGLCKGFGRTLGLSDRVGTIISCTDQTAVVHPDSHDLQEASDIHPALGSGCPGATSSICSTLTVADNDEDNDGVVNLVEANCGDGSYWNDATKVPEKTIAGDQNGNGLTNESLYVSYMDNGFPTDIYTASRIDLLDCDGDGYKGYWEQAIYSNATSARDQDRCTYWPSDLAADGHITLQDMATFVAPVDRLNTSVGDPNYSPRWDLIPSGSINLQDMAALTAGPTDYPPMFLGTRAYNGPSCTD